MSEEAREISLAGIRARKPHLSAEEARRELLVAIYGSEIVDGAWPQPGAARG